MIRFDAALFGEAIKRKRGQQSLRSVKCDIERIGEMSINTISRVERGQMPDIFTLEVLCEWLGVPPSHFFGEIESLDKSQETLVALSDMLATEPRLNSDDRYAVVAIVKALMDKANRNGTE